MDNEDKMKYNSNESKDDKDIFSALKINKIPPEFADNYAKNNEKGDDGGDDGNDNSVERDAYPDHTSPDDDGPKPYGPAEKPNLKNPEPKEKDKEKDNEPDDPGMEM